MVSNGSMQNSSKIYNYNYTCIQKRVDQFFILSSRSMMSLIWDDQQTSLTGAASNEGQATGHAGFVLHSVLGGDSGSSWRHISTNNTLKLNMSKVHKLTQRLLPSAGTSQVPQWSLAITEVLSGEISDEILYTPSVEIDKQQITVFHCLDAWSTLKLGHDDDSMSVTSIVGKISFWSNTSLDV